MQQITKDEKDWLFFHQYSWCYKESMSFVSCWQFHIPFSFLSLFLAGAILFVPVIAAFFITKNRRFPFPDVIYDNDFFRLAFFRTRTNDSPDICWNFFVHLTRNPSLDYVLFVERKEASMRCLATRMRQIVRAACSANVIEFAKKPA